MVIKQKYDGIVPFASVEVIMRRKSADYYNATEPVLGRTFSQTIHRPQPIRAAIIVE